MMSPITFQEHNFKAVVKKIKPVGEPLQGMRAGKPFVRDGRLMINTDEHLNLVEEVEFFDLKGNPIHQDDAHLDSDTRVAVVIIRGDEVLLMHRVKNGREYYIFPGGHKLLIESALEALVRETDEELGLQIKAEDAELLYEFEHDNSGPEKFYLVTKLLGFSSLKKENPDIKPGEVNTPVFMKIEDLSEADVFPKKVLEKLAYN